MKRNCIRIAALLLSFLLCAGAAAETADDLSYTMAEKLARQIGAGSGFIGTLTLNVTPAPGREGEALSTVKPLVMDWTYIKVPANAETGAAEETRLQLSLNAGDRQQGSADLSFVNGAWHLKSTLLDDSWYLLGDSALQALLGAAGTGNALPAASQMLKGGGLLPGTLSFFKNMAAYLIGADLEGMSEVMAQFTTKIDFWLEGFRSGVQMKTLEDGSSVMEIEYAVPAAAVKAQLKQLLIDLMNDEVLLSGLRALMPAEQAALYLDPSLEPYYFYAVDGLPLEGGLQIHRVLSFLGDTVELEVVMPLYDGEGGASILSYTRKRGAADMPDENTLRIEGAAGIAELSFSTYNTIAGVSVYQGTVLYEGAEKDGVKPQIVWASFHLSSKSVTTRDLNGFETLIQNLTLSIAPAELPQTADVSRYLAVPKADLALDVSFASLATKNSPTDMTAKFKLSGEGMAQDITLDVAASTAAKWTPEAFDPAAAASLAAMPKDELTALVSQAVIKGGLLFLPYVSLPLPTPSPAP